MNTAVKECFLCHEKKPLGLFYNDKRKVDGKKASCKKCTDLQKKKWIERNPEKERALRRDQFNLEIYRERVARWMKDPKKKAAVRARAKACRERGGPLKTQARSKLKHAVKMGLLIRPSKCQACGEEKKVEGHHPDYTKPLEVEWMCHRCHCRTHHGCLEHKPTKKS